MTLIPGALIPWVDRQFCDANGAPISGGKLYSYEAGGSTPANTYADSDLSVPNLNPVILDSSGRATIFIDSFGYRFVLTDANDVQIWDLDNIADLAQLYLGVLATATLTANVTSGYTILNTDVLVTVNSTGGPNPCLINLQLAEDRRTPITIKVVGDTPVQLIPQSGDVIEFSNALFDMPAAGAPPYPTVYLQSDGVANWYVYASHAIP